MADWLITEHAHFEMKRRGLSEELVLSVLRSPEQHVALRPGRDVLQSRVQLDSPAQTYLIRVFVDMDRNPPEVVTAYRTSKVSKYWRQGP
jgi:hypothetical protein